MRRLLLLVLLLPLLHANCYQDSYYQGLGGMREGAKVLLFKQGLPGDPVAIVPIGSLIAVASSDGTISYIDSRAVVRTLSICSGREVKMAHGITSKGGVIYAICYSREKQVASLAIIMDSGSFRFYEQPVPSRFNSSGTGFIYSSMKRDFPAILEPPAPLVADLNGDGYDEALAYLDGHLLYFESPLADPKQYQVDAVLGLSVRGRTVFVSTSSGIFTWGPDGLKPYSNVGCSSLPLAVDFDGDGKLEVVCRRGDTVQVVKEDSVIFRAEGGVTDPAIHDLNGDKRPELIYILKDGTLVARSSSLLWKAKVEAPYNRPVVADIDGDLKPEVIVAAGQYVYCFSNDGKEKWRANLREFNGWVSGGEVEFQRYVRFEAKTQPILLDYDRDGLLEILVGIGAYLEQGRIALLDEIGKNEAPKVEIISPSNYTKVGKYVKITFRVTDESSRLRVRVLSSAELWSGTVESGSLMSLEIPSFENIVLEASDGVLTTSSKLYLKVDTQPPKMVIEPANMSKISEGTNITVRIIAPIDEYAFLTVYHGTPDNWIKIIERRVWKTSVVSINVTPIVEMVSGYRLFKFHLVDKYGNVEDIVMRYKIERSKEGRVNSSGSLILSVNNLISKEARVNCTLIGLDRASLYYGDGADWKLIKEVNGNESFLWDVSSLKDGKYILKLESGSVSSLKEVTVDNTPPSLKVEADRSIPVGGAAIIRVEGDFQRLYWDLDGDGIFETSGPPLARIEGKEQGRIRVNVMGVDEANNSATARVEIEVFEANEGNGTIEVESSDSSKNDTQISYASILKPEFLALALLLVAVMMMKKSVRKKRPSNPWRKR